MIQTAFTLALGIEVPIMCGGMQWVGKAALAAAVSNAGGLGTITALTQPSPEALRAEIRLTRSLTDKPFCVNLTLLPSINPPPYEEYARVAIEEGVRCFETAGGQPAAIIKMAKAHGCYVIHKCTSIRHAKSAVALGVDCLSIDGAECAGHGGPDGIGGLVLLARAAEELNVPYLASGGIANGRGLAAALCLGAAGVNMGTRFMCTEESSIHQNIKEEIVKSTELNTTHIFTTMHNAARVYKNSIADEVVAIEKRPGGAKFPDIQHLVSGARGRLVYENGDVNAGVWSAGITIGLIHDIPSCRELICRMVRDAEKIIMSNNGQIVMKSRI